jgi:catechol 2,3-dioxygenase-like lactoylglutathione lyase family enzyme
VKHLALLVVLAGLGCAGTADGANDTKEPTMTQSGPASPAAFLGLRTGRYSARDLAAAKAWYTEVLGVPPYFDEPFYVGFNVGGYELGIVPDSSASAERPESGYAYWGVGNADSAFNRLIELGAVSVEPVGDVGEGIRVGTVRDPFGNLLGVIENPGFKAEQ